MDLSRQLRLIKNDFCLALTATSFMAITVVSTAIFFSAYREASYISTFLYVLRSPHPVIGFLLSVLACLTTVMVVCLTYAMQLKDARSKVRQKAFAGMGILALLTFIMGFWAIGVIKNRNRNDTMMQLKIGIVNYQLDNYTTFAMDAIQKELTCCGINGYEDWKLNKNYQCASKKHPFKCGIPPSCCKTPKNENIHDNYCGHENQLFEMGKRENRFIPNVSDDALMYTQGCLAGAEEALNHSGTAILVYIIFLIFIQIYTMFATFNANNHLKRLMSRHNNAYSFHNNSIRLNNRRRRTSQGIELNEGNNAIISCPIRVSADPGPSNSTNAFRRDPARTQCKCLIPRPTYMSPFSRNAHNNEDLQNLFEEGAMEDTEV